MKQFIITDKTTQDTYDQILLLQESNKEFELCTSCINSDTITKIIGFGEPIHIYMSRRKPCCEYDTIRELNMHDSSLVKVVCNLTKSAKNFVYSLFQDFIDDANLSAACIFLRDDNNSLTTDDWNSIIVNCLDHKLCIDVPAKHMDTYLKTLS